MNKLDKITLRLKESYRREEILEEDLRLLRRQKFRSFNNEECWIWNNDSFNENYVDSLVCPIVISVSDLMTIKKGEHNE